MHQRLRERPPRSSTTTAILLPAADDALGSLVGGEEGAGRGQGGDYDDADTLVQTAEELARGQLGGCRGVDKRLDKVPTLLPRLERVERVDEQVYRESCCRSGLWKLSVKVYHSEKRTMMMIIIGRRIMGGRSRVGRRRDKLTSMTSTWGFPLILSIGGGAASLEVMYICAREINQKRTQDGHANVIANCLMYMKVCRGFGGRPECWNT